MVVAELRDVPYVDATQLLIIRNVGASVARSVGVTFDPPIPDPGPQHAGSSVTPFLKRRYAKVIPVLTPGTELDNIYFSGTPGPGTWVNREPTPDQVTVRIKYQGPDGHAYEDSYPLDVELIRSRTYVTSSRSPEGQARKAIEVLKRIAVALERKASENQVSP